MEILKDFGVNPVLLVAQIVNFLTILFILKKFMYKPILNVLKKREDEIKRGIKDSESAEKKLMEALEKESKILKKAQERAEKIVSDSKLEAEETKAKIEDNARKESERILLHTRLTIEQETRDAEERLTRRIGEIAIALLEKSLKGIFGEKEQKTILKKATAQILKVK